MNITEHGDNIFIVGNAAIMQIPEPKSLYAKPVNEPRKFQIQGKGKEYRGIAYWGSNNNLPAELIEKIEASEMLGASLFSRAIVANGDGIIPVKRDENGKLHPFFGYKEVNRFIEENNLQRYFREASIDMQYFFKAFPEIICNNEPSPKVTNLYHKEAAFSRLEVMNDEGQVEHHFYSAEWEDYPDGPDNTEVTPMLSSINTIQDLKYRLGIEKDPMGKVKPTKDRRFQIPLDFGSPGKFYYPKPPYMAIFDSGWYDISLMIPALKSALLNNGMVIKYIVELHPQFWNKLYSDQKATTDAQKKTVKTTWLENLNDFLSKPENAGKTFISTAYEKGPEIVSMVNIKPLKNEFTGGEYINDMEEGHNIIAYAVGVHPSLFGSAPGKNKTINGTEARELFIILQAMLRAFRHELLFPLYVIKAINKWPDDIYFTVANLELTTIDNGTGAKKTISQPAIE